jgi:uncharacterized protein (TIGR04255 family)
MLPPDRDEVLPGYAHPPVVEVALAIEFEQPVGLRSLHLGRLADAWGDAWIPEERSLLSPMDALTDDEERNSFLSALLGTADPPPRLWLQNDAGDRVVQIQHDRLVVNWRKSDTNGDYPRYDTVREQLEDAWRQLVTICTTHLELDEPAPSLCEIQYVNHMTSDYGWASPNDTARLMVPWRGLETTDFFDANHLSQFSVHCHFPQDREGWLTIDCWTSHSSLNDPDDNSPLMSLKLTARGEAESTDLSSALEFFDVAHRWIVQGFTRITTPEAHKIWKRLQ